MNNKKKFFDITAPGNRLKTPLNNVSSDATLSPTSDHSYNGTSTAYADSLDVKKDAPSPQQHTTTMNSTNAQGDQNMPSQYIDNTDLAKSIKGGKPINKLFSVILNYLIMPAAIVWFLLSFIFQPFYVSGKSMEPTLNDKDYLIVSKIGLSMDKLLTKLGKDNNHPVQRGDIVVFHYPASPKTFFIKRLVGLPGDRVVIKEGIVTIFNQNYPSGLQLSEKYIDPQYKTAGDIDQVVTDNNYFVMGDNRSSGGSFDSRNWGMLPKHYMVGSMLIRLMPSIKVGSS
jgi:signal peptidase I